MELWQKQFIKSLFHYSARYMDIEKAFLVKHPHVPDRLYKYRNFCDHHLDALKKNVLWLSSPNKLNDPYEAQVSFDVDRVIIEDQSIEDFSKQVREAKQAIEAGGAWRPNFPARPIKAGDWRRKMVSTVLQSSDLPEKEAIICVLEEWIKTQSSAQVEYLSQKFREGFSVLSLSATANNKLLWAHY